MWVQIQVPVLVLSLSAIEKPWQWENIQKNYHSIEWNTLQFNAYLLGTEQSGMQREKDVCMREHTIHRLFIYTLKQLKVHYAKLISFVIVGFHSLRFQNTHLFWVFTLFNRIRVYARMEITFISIPCFNGFILDSFNKTKLDLKFNIETDAKCEWKDPNIIKWKSLRNGCFDRDMWHQFGIHI